MDREPGREVYFEIVAVGNALKVIAIDSVTAVEVSVMGPPGAEAGLRHLALRKLAARLEKK